MDLNKAMVELYKQRSTANKRKSLQASSNTRTAGKDQQQDKRPREGITGESPHQKQRPKVGDVVASLDYKPKATFDRLFGCDQVRDQVLKIVSRFERSNKGLAKKSNWPVLIYGSHGLGKTSIVEAAANHAKLKLIPIFLKTLVEQTRSEFQVSLMQILKYSLAIQPAIILIDDLEQINDKEDHKNLLRGTITKILSEESNLLLFCTTNYQSDGVAGIDFLFTIHLKRPDAAARLRILDLLKSENKNLEDISENSLISLAENTPSFTALDLKKMLDIAETESDGKPKKEHCDRAIEVVKQSFRSGTHLIGEKPTVTWQDIGGLSEVRQEFLAVLRQIKQGVKNCKFAGIALYGPPGCGKTMVAQAMANEAGLNFISIKPAELVDKFLGETEKNIRRVFKEAQEYEPCMIYFDEFDGLCGTRGTRDNVTSAIQTLLSEMDGFAGRGKSIILASTNRLEDIDPAMKRPGRLSKHIYVGPPDEKARRDILGVIANRPYLLLAHDINLDDWARKTINFTGADLDFLIAEAESKALGESDCANSISDSPITIKDAHIVYALEKIQLTNNELGRKRYKKT